MDSANQRGKKLIAQPNFIYSLGTSYRCCLRDAPSVQLSFCHGPIDSQHGSSNFIESISAINEVIVSSIDYFFGEILN